MSENALADRGGARSDDRGDDWTPRELKCLYTSARLMNEDDSPLEAVLRRVADTLAGSLRHPGAACAQIRVGSQCFESARFRATNLRISAAIVSSGAEVGTLDAYSLDGEVSGPFAGWERRLVATLARDVGAFVRRRRVLAEHLASRARQLEAQRVAHLGFWEWDMASDHLYWSDEIYRIFGLEPQEFGATNEAFLAALHHDDRELLETHVRAALRGDAEYSIDYRILLPTEEVRYVHAQAEVSRNGDGRATRLVGTVIDITDRKNLERQLIQAQKMDAIGRLAGGVAHDFNNILAVILSFGSFVREAVDENDPARDDIDEVLTAAKRAVGLTRQLLAFSRRQVIEPRVMNINKHVLGTDKMLRRLLGADVELATIPDEDLWLTRIDPGHLEQILVNLAVNARDAMPDGGKLTIETQNVVLGVSFVQQHEGASLGEHVMLAVSDNGMGMSSEVKDRALEPFFTTKAAGKGTGLGLATCYGIAKQAGGSIWVYSEVGRGTTIKVYLPRARDASEEFVPTREPRLVAPGTETVLVVEDDRAVRALATRTLGRHGYEILEAENGGEALRLCEQHADTVDLVLTDMVMPQLGGRELARRLATSCPNLKVLFMSGYTDNASLRGNILPEGTAFLQKPFMPDDLARKVREVLDEQEPG